MNSNASKGFNQKFVPATYLKYESDWPLLRTDTSGNVTDVSKSSYNDGYVATYVFPGSTGWVTAYSSKYRLLLGYVWATKDYPWLHIWHGTKNGKLIAKGLEFGTTGLGDTSPLEQRFMLNFHGVTNLNYVDAQSSIKKNYTCFLFKLDEDTDGVNDILLASDKLIIKFDVQGKETIRTFDLN